MAETGVTSELLPKPRQFSVGEKLYSSVKPLGIGSIIAETYLARAADGTEIVVKKPRPDKLEQALSEIENLRILREYQQKNFSGNTFVPKGFKVMDVTDIDHSYVGNEKAEGINLSAYFEKSRLGDIPAEKQLSEKDAIFITTRLAWIITSCHLGLKKAGVDIHLGDIFWDAQNREVTVIDWNAFASDYHPEEMESLKERDYRHVGKILYHLITSKPLSSKDTWDDLERGRREVVRLKGMTRSTEEAERRYEDLLKGSQRDLKEDLKLIPNPKIKIFLQRVLNPSGPNMSNEYQLGNLLEDLL